MIRLELDGRAGPAKRLADGALGDWVAAAIDRHEAEAATRPLVAPPSVVTPVDTGRRRVTGTWFQRALVLGITVGAVGGVSAAVTHAIYRARDEAALAVRAPRPAATPPVRTEIVHLAAAEPRTETPPGPKGRLAPAADLHALRLAPRARAAVSPDLEVANRLRAERRWPEAARAYASYATKATGAEASIAAVAAASLELEQLHRPRAARKLYLQALARGSAQPVAEEAHWGLVGCARAVGDRGEEDRALRVFLAAHPGSVWRAQAEARLAALTGAAP